MPLLARILVIHLKLHSICPALHTLPRLGCLGRMLGKPPGPVRPAAAA